MLTLNIHTLCWNDSLLMQFAFDHYKSRFPNSKVDWYVYDFGSDDGCKELAVSLGMKVFHVDTGGTLDDITNMQLKNNVWKKIGGWAIVTDFDEFLDFDEKQMAEELVNGTTVLKIEGWDVCNVANLENFSAITTGMRYPLEDKNVCFDARLITEMRYGPGAHQCDPLGLVKYSDRAYRLLHMKYLNEEYVVKRWRALGQRVSARNRQLGFGFHYSNFDEEKVRARYRENMAKAVVFQ